MPWTVLISDQVRAFIRGLSQTERLKVVAKIKLLEEVGHNLARPNADTVEGSRHANMKELRIKSSTKEFRILFAFDRERRAVLLFGGDKVPYGGRWYQMAIAKADEEFDRHTEAGE